MQHGGVGIYVKQSIRYKTIDDFSNDEIDALWVWLRPTRIPRGVPCVIAGSVYHPQFLNDKTMLEYLSSSLTAIEGLYPGCEIMLCGDFNRLNVSRLTSQFKLKQLVDKATRGNRILDLAITNLAHLYDKNSVSVLSPFRLIRSQRCCCVS